MRFLLIIIGSLLLTACAGEPTKLNYYLLRSDIPQDSSREMNPSGIALTNIKVATYIDQPGLVLQTSDGQINPAGFHVWAEPLRHSLMKFLATEISNSAGKDIYVGRSTVKKPEVSLTITIDQLHGTADGNAVLVGYWSITSSTDGKPNQTTYQFSKTLPLVSSGYGALVDSEKQLLKAFASEIAKSL